MIEITTILCPIAETLDERQRRGLSTWIASSAARVVTVCDAPLHSWVADGCFPADLYYRLNTVTLVENPDPTPPRRRQEDEPRNVCCCGRADA
jgi:transcriptional regulator with PAS, ATPase and Fis domain